MAHKVNAQPTGDSDSGDEGEELTSLGVDGEDPLASTAAGKPALLGIPSADPPLGFAFAFWSVALILMTAVACWTAYATQQSLRMERERSAFAEAARHGAVAFTSLDYRNADADVARVMEMSTGAFRDDFKTRSRQFITDALRTKTTSVGSVSEVGVETIDGNEAEVLVALRVTSTREVSPDPEVHSWRLRITVERIDGGMKLSNIGFVP